MSDKKPAPTGLEMLNKSMDEVARQIGGMDLDDPTRSEVIKELCALGQLRASLKSDRDKLFNQRMDRLVHELGTLKPDDPRHAQLVSQILRLNDLLSAK
jgi:hypothetical protein